MGLLARAGVWFLGALAASPAAAGTFVADFSSPAQYDAASSTAVWDTVGKRVRAADVANGTELNYGSGADGDFRDGASQIGIPYAPGTTIALDTSREYNFTSFNLSATTTLTATGTKPLVIRVLGPATIAGTIDLSGQSGSTNSENGPASGGAAGAGGGRGGDGGYGPSPTDTSSSNGEPSSGSPALGGNAGSNENTTFQDQGGGGGCNGTGGGGSDAAHGLVNSISGGTGAAGACTSSRSTIASTFETTFTGGGGGGGGGDFNSTTASQIASGSGGGGAGGAIHFIALGSISFGAGTGIVQANGGAGGGGALTYVSGDGNDCGGSGGGGSGGSIWIQTPAALASSSAKATINVNAGSGGTDAGKCGDQADGGAGSTGVSRVDAASVNTNASPTSTFTPSIPANKTFTLLSKPFDSGSSAIAYQSPQVTFDTTSTGCGSTGSIAVEYEGSNDNTNFSGDVPGDQISILDGYRYIRFKVTIKTDSNTSTSTPAPCLTALSIPYSSTQFALKGGLACGSLSAIKGSSSKKRGTDLGGLSDLALLGIAAAAAVGPLRGRRRKSAQRPA